jgi:hypothetical protein
MEREKRKNKKNGGAGGKTPCRILFEITNGKILLFFSKNFP